jgi:hypothetical protein
MAPKLKTPKATEMAAATVASVDNFIAIMRFAWTLSGEVLSSRRRS